MTPSKCKARLLCVAFFAACAALHLSCDIFNSQNEDETAAAVGSNKTAPTAAEIAGTWQARKRVSHDTIFVKETGEGCDTTFVLEITAGEIIFAEIDDDEAPDTCACVERYPYSLSGNAITGNEFAGVDTEDVFICTYSTTWQKSGTQLILTFIEDWTANQTDGGHTERGHWYEREVCYFEPWPGAVPPVSWSYPQCADCDASIAKSLRAESNELVGKWIMVKEEAQETAYEEEILDISSLDDYFAVITGDSITLYHGDPDQSMCYEVKQAAYTLEGIAVKGSDFEDSETGPDEFDYCNTNLYFNEQSQLVLEFVEIEGVDYQTADETVYEIMYDTVSYYFEKSDETPPLATWPSQTCELSMTKRRAAGR